MSDSTAAEDIAVLTVILETENAALIHARIADAIALLPQKQKAADRLAEHRLSEMLPVDDIKIALRKLSKLVERNAALLRQAIRAQENVVRLLTTPAPSSEQTLYGRSGHYTTGPIAAPTAISACG